ncbi:hypothetical protein Pmani_011253 [Petrolisthes manimaculis]|uniref:Uncharacterized protein n=1 Tax=Petrolisthes manimaculis TaxID=1843537 RepID=A0AAE1UFV6_9EUCA|nr:hypothetical protein Pmani_011253 [Petrolisthes manimaculis]
MDVLPTLASLTGSDTSHLTLDGSDVTNLLLNPYAESPRKYLPMYPESPDPLVGPLAVTNGTYKAHFYTKGSDLSDADNYDPLCPARHKLTRHDPPLLYHLHHDPGERYPLPNLPPYSGIIEELTKWRQQHMNTTTWMQPLTRTVDPFAQPCCTDPTCDPFPACCDCPPTLTPPPSPPSPPSPPPAANAIRDWSSRGHHHHHKKQQHDIRHTNALDDIVLGDMD